MIIAISGSGQGAGKTTLANRLGDETWSIAGLLRKDLTLLHPDYDWYNKTQDYKDKTIVKGLGVTVREVLYQYGQQMCQQNGDTYWADKLVDALKERMRICDGTKTFCIDDVRKICEIKTLTAKFDNVLHMHVLYERAVYEPQFENELLGAVADYTVVR